MSQGHILVVKRMPQKGRRNQDRHPGKWTGREMAGMSQGHICSALQNPPRLHSVHLVSPGKMTGLLRKDWD